MKGSESNLMAQWMSLEMTLHRFHNINFKRMGPAGAPQRGQGRLLCLIRERPGITQKELCETSGMRQQSVSELLKKLENGGFITRSPSTYDRRISTFSPNPRCDRLPPPPREAVDTFNRVFSCLNEEEKTALGNYLERVRKNIDSIIEAEQINAKTAEPLI